MRTHIVTRPFALSLLACAGLALTAGCGGKEETAPPTAAEPPAPPPLVKEMIGAAAEQAGADEDVLRIMRSEDGMSQLATITAEVGQRTAAAQAKADIMTPEGRRQFADELEAIATDIRARVPDLDPSVRDHISELADDLAEGAADMRKRDQ